MKKMILATLLGAYTLAGIADIPPLAKPTKNISKSIGDKKADELGIPKWMRDSEKLAKMLQGDQLGKVKDPKVIKRMSTPIAGLDALVLEAIIEKPNEAPRKETFVFYTDKTDKYLIAGLFIDVEKNTNYGQNIERLVRGERAENPAKALNPMTMHSVSVNGLPRSPKSIYIVVDVGPELGRKNILNIAILHQKLTRAGSNVRPIHVIPVSSMKKGSDSEISTVAMAMALGYESLRPGDGYNKLIEFSSMGEKSPWLAKDRLLQSELKQIIGAGIFKMEENTSQSVFARLNTLPLVYVLDGAEAKYHPTPTTENEWKALITAN